MTRLALLTSAALLSTAVAQSPPSVTDWQADLRFLQQTVHADYPFLFKKTTAASFDAQVQALHDAIPTLAPHEVQVGFARVLGSFRYGHTGIGWNGAPVAVRSAPLNLYWFVDGIRVEGAHRDHADVLGARVLRVEGRPVDEVLAAIRPVAPAENDQYFKAQGLRLLLVPEVLHAQRVTDALMDTVTLTLERDGRSAEYTFAAAPPGMPRRYGLVRAGGEWVCARGAGAPPLYLRNLDRAYEFEFLPEHETLYVRQSKCLHEPDESIAEFYRRVFEFVAANDVDRLVLDVRLNGGGDNFNNKPVVTGIVRCAKIDRPGHLFVIIGRQTFSACQNLVNELDNYTNAIFVGEPTAENVNFYGDTNRVELPRTRLAVFLSFAWWQDKPQWQNADWLAPDMAVEPTFADYRDNRDPVLDAILALPRDEPMADPEAHLAALIAVGELEEFATEVRRLVADPRHKFVQFEPALNRAGYDLLGRSKVDEALFVLRLNTELFPGSANAWDSLGEATWRAGDPERAVEHYERAIQLDPDGRIGQNAREMLQKIRRG